MPKASADDLAEIRSGKASARDRAEAQVGRKVKTKTIKKRPRKYKSR